MAPIEQFFIKDQVSKSKGMTIAVNGGLLSSREKLVLLFSDRNNRAYSITIEGPTTGIEHFIPGKRSIFLQIEAANSTVAFAKNAFSGEIRFAACQQTESLPR